MTSEQIAFFPSDETLARRNAEATLSSFIGWFDALPVTEGDRPHCAWFATQVREYFNTPMLEPWSNV